MFCQQRTRITFFSSLSMDTWRAFPSPLPPEVFQCHFSASFLIPNQTEGNTIWKASESLALLSYLILELRKWPPLCFSASPSTALLSFPAVHLPMSQHSFPMDKFQKNLWINFLHVLPQENSRHGPPAKLTYPSTDPSSVKIPGIPGSICSPSAMPQAILPFHYYCSLPAKAPSSPH